MPAARATAHGGTVPARPDGRIAPFGLGAACALLAGVLVVQRFPALPPWPVVLVAAAAGLAAWMRRDRGRWAGAALTGIALACAHAHAALAVRLPPALAGRELVIDVRVLGLPESVPDGVQFDARIERGDGASAVLAGRRVRLAWFVLADGPRPPGLVSGDRLTLVARLRRPHGLVNPGGFDFERRAAEQRLAAVGYVVAAAGDDAARKAAGDAAGTAASGAPRAWRDAVDRVRDGLAARIAAALPPASARFVAALALGDTRGLSDADWAVLRATGLTHLIAISGFHVGLVAGFGALLGAGAWRLLPSFGRRLPRPQAAAAAALLAAAVYTALAGFALPTVRTLAMIAAALAARLARRQARGADAFAFALIVVLAIDPLAVLAPGFWLSFAGVAWLLWCLPPAEGTSAEARRGVVATFLHAQAVAVLGLLPLTVWFFGQASTAGPLANLVGIPWISLGVVPLCLLGLAASPFSETAAATLWGSAARLMDLLWTPLEHVAAAPASLVWLPEPSLFALVLALAGAGWCLLPRGVPGRALAGCLLLPLVAPAPDRPPAGEADLWLLDTGQGLALLVRTARHDLLYDAGPATPGGADLGASTVVPALRALGVERLATLVVSHGDADHAGGAGAVRRELSPARALAPPGWARPPFRDCLAGDRWRVDGVGFVVLHPPRFFPYQRNESSCVLRIEAAGASALLAGDIGRHVEARLAKRPPAEVGADVLLVPHHGSASSSSLGFLAAVRPRIALLAVGRDNRFGLPEPRVLARYDRYRVDLHDTAGDGAIHVRLGRDGARVVERLRRDRPRWWRDARPPPPG